MKKISIIVAISENYGIGKDNKLLCYLSDDLKRFKKLTTANVVVMGKVTYKSLPKGALPNRKNIVITDDNKDNFDSCVMVHSIEDAIEKCDDVLENFIIGGGSIYRQFLPFANKLYLTKIHKSFEADTFFPEINFDEWNLIEQEDFKADEKNQYDYTYLIYERK